MSFFYFFAHKHIHNPKCDQSFTNVVAVYSLNDDLTWTLKKDYFCKLDLFDGFVRQIDFSSDNFLKRFYELNKNKKF